MTKSETFTGVRGICFEWCGELAGFYGVWRRALDDSIFILDFGPSSDFLTSSILSIRQVTAVLGGTLHFRASIEAARPAVAGRNWQITPR